MSTTNPHDALFRGVFSKPENAQASLRAILPEAFGRRVDWDTLRLEPGSYIEPDLRALYSDLLYSAHVEGAETFVYLLFEHQSTTDALMPLRLLRYMVAVWERWLREHDNAKSVPAILPVVLSNAEGGWDKPVSMAELYALSAEAQAEVQEYLPSFRLVLDDLATRSDDELIGRAGAALGVLGGLALRHARGQRSFGPLLAEWAELVRAVFSARDGREALGMLVRYALLANQLTTVQDLSEALVPILGEVAREVVMTEGEQLIQTGVERGRTEGRTEGRAASVIAVLQARGLAVAPVHRARIESCSDIEQLDRWIARAATAASVDDVFASS